MDFVDVKVVEDRRGKIGRPSKTNRPIVAFEFRGDKIRFPDQYQEELWNHYQNCSNPEECRARVRYSKTGFEYEITSFCPLLNSTIICQQGKAKSDSNIPVQSELMKILTIHRAKRFRGYHYEIELENHGRFMGPPTITKNLVEYMRKNGDIHQDIWKDKEDTQLWVDVRRRGYFLGHATSARGTVRGGKGRAEEYIKIIKDFGRGERRIVLESEGTRHAEED